MPRLGSRRSGGGTMSGELDETDLKLLGRLGAIKGTHAQIDPDALGLGLLAFVFVGWSEGAVETDFLKRVATADQVLECHHVTGGWNYLLKVRVKDTRAL